MLVTFLVTRYFFKPEPQREPLNIEEIVAPFVEVINDQQKIINQNAEQRKVEDSIQESITGRHDTLVPIIYSIDTSKFMHLGATLLDRLRKQRAKAHSIPNR